MSTPYVTTPGITIDVDLADDRRKAQNRLAQRRFRQKKALKKGLSADADANPNPNPLGLPPGENAFVQPTAALSATAASILTPPSTLHQPYDVNIADTPLSASAAHAGSIDDALPWTDSNLFDDFLFTDSLTTSDTQQQQQQQQSHPTPASSLSHHSGISPSILFGPRPDKVASRNAMRAKVEAAWIGAPKMAAPTWDGPRNEPLIHTAVRKGDLTILALLSAANANINERDDEGRSAMHIAIENQECEVIFWLLENGIDVNACDARGRTGLSMSVNNRCEEGVRLFLAYGADPMIH